MTDTRPISTNLTTYPLVLSAKLQMTHQMGKIIQIVYE